MKVIYAQSISLGTRVKQSFAARDLVTLMLQRVLQRVAGFAGLYFLVRHLTPTAFGEYQFVLTVATAVSFLALTGLENAIMQAVARGSTGVYRRATLHAFRFSLLGGVALGVVALIMQDRIMVSGSIVVAALLFPFYFGLCQWKSVLLAQRKFSDLSMAEVSNAVITQMAIVGATFLEIRNIPLIVFLFLAPTCLINLAMTAVCAIKSGPSSDKTAEQELIKYGRNTSFIAVLSVIAEQIERLVLFLLINPAVLAAYLAADRISELIRSVVQDTAAVLAPRFARMKEYSGVTQKIIAITCAVASIVIVAFAFTVAPGFLLLLFGEKYRASIPYAQALLCSVAVGNVGQFHWRFIRSQIDTHSFRKVIVMTSVPRIIGSIVMIYFYGVWGAVANLFIYRILFSFVCYRIIRKYYTA